MWQEGRDVGPKEARDPALQWGPCALPLPRAVCLSLLGCPDLDGRLIRQLSCGAEGVSCRAGPGLPQLSTCLPGGDTPTGAGGHGGLWWQPLIFQE